MSITAIEHAIDVESPSFAIIAETALPLMPPVESPPIPAELLDTLEALGSSEAIAKFFYHEGVRGIRNSTWGCPIAKWLRVVSGENYNVHGATVGDRGAVSRFMREFDAGRFPQLAVGVMTCSCPECSCSTSSMVPIEL